MSNTNPAATVSDKIVPTTSGSLARRRRIDDHMVLVKGEAVRGHYVYTIDQLVGAGAYAAVYRAHDELGRVVALKEYFPATTPREVQGLRTLWERERYVLNQVSPHPLMPTFYDAFDYNSQLYIAQEFVDGQTLAEIIQRYKKIDNEWMLKWAVNLCDALTFLHERCIVHHDLKPANLKITPEGHLFLLDYGAAQYFGDKRGDVPEAFQTDTDLYGTEGYLPPEVEENFVADVQTDIFSLGCILYEMVMGIAPEQQRINERNLAVVTPLTRRNDVEMEYVKLVTTALSYNTEYRYASAQMFLQEMRKIAPPVPMVSHKNLYFGTVDWRKADAAQHFLIWNSGKNVDIAGDIICRTPWLRVDHPRFQGRRREVAVVCVPSRAPAFNVPLRGDIDIIVNEVRDHEGNIVSRADKWTVHCYAVIQARPAKLEMVGYSETGKEVALRSMKGVTTRVRAVLANRGEMPTEFRLEPRDKAMGLEISPAMLRLLNDETAEIDIRFNPGKSLPLGETRTEFVAIVQGEEIATFPVVLQVVSPMEYARSAFGMGR